MPLVNYRLYSPSLVIEDDDRDPYVSWEHHLERTKDDVGGPRGGVDLVAAVGTPIYAPTDGTVERMPNNGGAGNSMQFWHDANPGWRDVFSHLVKYATGPTGNWFRQGQIIGWTGDSGGVAPHLHRHLLDPNDVRRNPWDYFTPINKEKDETIVAMKQMHVTDQPGTQVRALFNDDSGYFTQYTGADSAFPNAASTTWKAGPSIGVTQSLFDQIKADCEKVRTRSK